ncbi:MAG: chloride channel protein [Eubacteriales bacterium]
MKWDMVMKKRFTLRLIPFVVGSTWITHLFGGSAGREGVAVQIGATFSHWIGRHLPIKNAGPIFLVAGMAAGFSGLFGTPIAAVFFAMEVLVIGEMKFEALLPAFTASIAASTTSQALGLSKFTFILSENISFSWILLAQLLLLGLIFGVVGGLFAWCLKLVKRFLSDKIKNPIVRIALVGVGLSALFLLLYQGRYSGLGTNLIRASFHNGTIYGWDWILKFILYHCDSFSRISRRRSDAFVFNWSQHLEQPWRVCLVFLYHLWRRRCGLPSCIRRRYKYLFGSIIGGGGILRFESDLPYFFIVCLPFPMCLMQINLFIYKKQKTR